MARELALDEGPKPLASTARHSSTLWRLVRALRADVTVEPRGGRGRVRDVSLQEPVLRAVHAEFGWSLAPRFPDMRGQITELMTMHTRAPDAWVWDADPPLVLAWNEERHLHLAAGGSFFEVVAEDANGPDAASAAHGLLSQIASVQNVSSLKAVEVTFVWLLAGEDRAGVAAELEERALIAGAREVFGPFGGRPDHVEIAAEFGADALTTTRVDLRSLNDTDMAEGPEFLADFSLGDLPPAALRFRLHRRQVGDFSVAEALERLDRHLEGARNAGERFLGNLTGS